MIGAPLLTELRTDWDVRCGDGVRAIAWSTGGRVVVVDAAGSTLVDVPGRASAPIGPDPIAAAWLGERRMIVADGTLGAVVVGGGGGGHVDPFVPECLGQGHGIVVAGYGDELVVWREHADAVAVMAPSCGRVRAVAPLTAGRWVVVGAAGVALVDVVGQVVEVVVALDGGISIAADPRIGLVAVGDLGGSVHLVDLASGSIVSELEGYPDRVRRMGWSVAESTHLVAAADDEMTWWAVGADLAVADAPRCAHAHTAAVTALAVAPAGMVASGDEHGVVRLWSPKVPDRPVWSMDLGRAVTAVAWRHDAGAVAIGDANGRVVRLTVDVGVIA